MKFRSLGLGVRHNGTRTRYLLMDLLYCVPIVCSLSIVPHLVPPIDHRHSLLQKASGNLGGRPYSSFDMKTSVLFGSLAPATLISAQSASDLPSCSVRFLLNAPLPVSDHPLTSKSSVVSNLLWQRRAVGHGHRLPGGEWESSNRSCGRALFSQFELL